MKIKKIGMGITLFSMLFSMLSINTNARGQVSREAATYSDTEMDRMIAQQYKLLREAYNMEDAFKLTKRVDKIDSFLVGHRIAPVTIYLPLFVKECLPAETISYP